MLADLDDQVLPILTGPTLPELLGRTVEERGAQAYASFDGTVMSFAELVTAVADAQRGLAVLGVRPGDRVAVMLPNHLEHVVLIHALVGMGAIWVPVNPRLRGDPLAHLLADSDPRLLLVDSALVATLPSSVTSMRVVEYRPDGPAPWRGHGDATADACSAPPGPDDVVSIMYTSGTTGPGKGVQVTDRMLRAAALGVVAISEPRDGDVFFLWEPLCHVGGAQVLFLPLVVPVRLALVDRFSVSRFWSQVRDAGATHVHHLGGIIPMLLSRPPTDDERVNPVRVSWGGGMTKEAWSESESRFGMQVRECYGMTEAASISTVNVAGADDGIGQALPWFDVQVHDESGAFVPDGVNGEIVLRPLVDGLLTPGYFRHGDTASSLRGRWWRTGDRGRFVGGSLHFVGRVTDSVRHRGENVSAWEVESVVNAHPAVAESAVVGVPAKEGDEDIKLFVTLADPDTFDAEGLIGWCRERLASFQVPRYVAVVESFAKTPSLRVQKAALPRTAADSYDATAGPQ